ADEFIDPRPTSELLRQWSTLHPEFAYLPRKFKFAITGAGNDRALIKAHDIGLQLSRDENGLPLTDIWVGGGQGRTPKIAQRLYRRVPLKELIPHLEAILRIYNQYGRRDNKYKARIKILLADLGVDTFRALADEERSHLSRKKYAGIEATYEDIAARFTLPTVDTASGEPPVAEKQSTLSVLHSASFTAWQNQNTRPHKHADHSIVVVSLKSAGAIPGDLDAEGMRAIAALARRFSHNELRVTHRQNLVFPHVRRADLHLLWSELKRLQLAEDNIDLPSDIIACPGLDYCALATARSIPIAQSVSQHIRQREKEVDLTGVTVNISGCINACAHHHVASIGVLGLDRGGTENYQITLGGRADGDIQLGERMGPGVAAEQVPSVVERVVNLYVDRRQTGESFDATFRRIGKAPFRSAVYGEDDGKAIA
ncbi:MAG: nitrite/sulfite reductase, partial [Gammaproteobacteria bacterium]|nr:nitrite/sulfite reductase [Gammaproteobacteria bacterium]